MRVIPCIDQLRVHPHLVAGALHTAFQDMGDTESLADITQVPRGRVPELHDAGAADDLEVGELRQSRQDLVLHAVSEERVLLVIAEILER